MEAAQKSALILILGAMKSTPTEALESELNVVPIDLRLEELQWMEVTSPGSIYHQQYW